MNLLIKGGHILDPSQGLDAIGDLYIVEGKITWVEPLKEKRPLGKFAVIPASGLLVCPGFVDLHCHLRQPGYEDKETIASGTRAAAKGGFTTLCCMPNTKPPVDSQAVVEYVQRTAHTEGVVRVYPIGCISKGLKGEELAEMGELAAAGVMAYSDDGQPVTSSRLMRHALEYSLAFGRPIIDHCEDKALSADGAMNEGWVATRLGLKGIPAAAEEAIVARDIALAELTGACLHIAHVSTAGSVDLLRRAKDKGLAVTAEVTPHHLTLTEERVMGFSTQTAHHTASALWYDTNAKVNPPLRSEKDRQALLEALKDDTIDAIATDHAPHTIVDKLCEFDAAAFGISGLETALGCLLSLVHSGQLDLKLLISKLTWEPVRILEIKKASLFPTSPLPWGLGTLQMGAPGDVTIFDPSKEWVVNPNTFASKGKNTPWAGCQLKGQVMATVVAGNLAYRDDSLRLEGQSA
ncbi:MAG: dihydroorotase [Chloroflexi bacterium]|nr:dihydroorotase [Chloroflexota bacterium]